MKSFLALFAACLGMSGCRFTPEYPKDLLTKDPGVIGTWELRDPETQDSATVVIEDRPGRPADFLSPAEPGGYLVTLKFKLEQAKKDNWPESMVGDAVLFKVGEQVYVGVHIAGKQPSGQLPFGVVLPVHTIFKLKRDDNDTMIGTMPTRALCWIAADHWLDAAPKPGDEAIERYLAAQKGEVLYTNSIERVIDVIRRYGDKPGFWGNSWSLHRLPKPTTTPK